MDYRKQILIEAWELWKTRGPNNFYPADTLKSFSPSNQAFLTALNQLLAEGLIIGLQGPDKRLSIAINPKQASKVEDIVTGKTIQHETLPPHLATWITGGFYLIMVVAVLMVLGWLVNTITNPWLIPLVFVAGLLIIVLLIRPTNRLIYIHWREIIRRWKKTMREKSVLRSNMSDAGKSFVPTSADEPEPRLPARLASATRR